jgi:tetratricopeptide (TPR) repeat protein
MFAQAFDHWETALTYVREVNDQTQLVSVLASQANGFFLADHYQQAIDAAREAQKLFERFGETDGVALTTQILADAHAALGNLAAAEEFATQVLRTEEPESRSDALRTLGTVKLKQGNYQDAEHYIQQSITAAQEVESLYNEAYARRVLGSIYQARGERDKAQAEWTSVIEMFESFAAVQEAENTRNLLESL